MRLRSVFISACVLLLSGPAFAQEWKEYASRQDGFTCNFPGDPTITETTYTSEFGADLPARVYSASLGPSRFSITVVDYSRIEPILIEKSKSCPPGAETCLGNQAASSSTGAGYWRADLAGAVIYATWTFMQRDAKVTHFLWSNMDLVGGHQIHLTNNTDRSRTEAGVYMHQNKLFIVEGTVPEGYPEPGLFQQSLGWIDENGRSFRYNSLYVNGFPAPNRTLGSGIGN